LSPQKCWLGLNSQHFDRWAARVLVNSAEACRHGRKVPTRIPP
jgi:hypothetical protein